VAEHLDDLVVARDDEQVGVVDVEDRVGVPKLLVPAERVDGDLVGEGV
jgi:hypothetical protein